MSVLLPQLELELALAGAQPDHSGVSHGNGVTGSDSAERITAQPVAIYVVAAVL